MFHPIQMIRQIIEIARLSLFCGSDDVLDRPILAVVGCSYMKLSQRGPMLADGEVSDDAVGWLPRSADSLRSAA